MQRTEFYTADAQIIPVISKALVTHFTAKGYELDCVDGYAGGKFVSITKGGFFRSILGLKTALNVSITTSNHNKIKMKASIGLFGTQIIPTLITLLVFWPVLITQLWGIVKQYNLDDEIFDVACQVISDKVEGDYLHGSNKCDCCDQIISHEAHFCPHCGKEMTIC